MKEMFLVLFALLLFGACNIINPDEDEPTYVTINDFDLITTSGQGGNTEKIRDAWVYVNSQLVGAYELPATFPVLDKGQQIVEVFAGIKVNGISEIPDIYPFYERDSILVDFQGGEVTLSPEVMYRTDAEFELVEQFNGFDHKMQFNADNITETAIELVTDDRSLDGSSGYIHLDTMTSAFFDVGSIVLDEFPVTANSFFLELDYKTDLQINIGLVGYDVLGTVVGSNFNQGVLPNTEWNKIYLDLSGPMSEIRILPTISYYRLHFTAAIIPGNDENRTEADLFFDNIKLLKF